MRAEGSPSKISTMYMQYMVHNPHVMNNMSFLVRACGSFHTSSASGILMMMSCYCLGWKSRDSVPKLVEDYLGKKVKVDEFVSHTFTLTDINQAFEVMHQGKR